MAKLYFYYSSMNAGKSAHLLQSSFNYKERGMNTLLFNARLDNRMGNETSEYSDEGVVASRIGISEKATLFDAMTNFEDEVTVGQFSAPLNCILVDEAQFLTKAQVDQLAAIVDDLKIPVLAYGLRTDFRGELFEGSQRLLGIADELCELKGMCGCGKKATMVIRINGDGTVSHDGNQIEVGGNNRYVSVCRRHHKLSLENGYLIDTK